MKHLRKFAFASTSVLILWLGPWFTTATSAQTISQLFAFGCDSNTKVCPDGQNPNSLIQSADGNFYGTTTVGGIGNQAGGTVFKITPTGHLTVVYTFVADAQGNYPNGWFPSSLVEGNDGFLYGTSLGGGANTDGAVFKLSKTGKIQVLHSVCNSCGEGAEPSHLILASDGNFYGVAEAVLFRITPTGSFKVLYTFGPNLTGIGMMQATDGNLYGTVVGGRTLLTPLFRLTRSGQFATLHTFHYPDFATSVPIEGSDGRLYGTSTQGLFVSSLSGNGFAEFSIPAGQSIVQASDLNLWTTVFFESNAVNGVIQQISTKGSVLQTIAFDGTDGTGPNAPLLQGSDGKLLGVTYTGGTVPQGAVANGVVCTLDAGLAAPLPTIVSFNPSGGVVGSRVMIHGSHFVGTTAVTFNGLSASFQVLNTGNILATVPTGATTGPVAVINAGGTAKSQKSFTVQ